MKYYIIIEYKSMAFGRKKYHLPKNNKFKYELWIREKFFYYKNKDNNNYGFETFGKYVFT